MTFFHTYFDIFGTKKVVWEKRDFSNILSRFYGEKLPEKSFKEKHCGNGPFISIVVKQDNPIYEERKTSKGEALVNRLLYDKKQHEQKKARMIADYIAGMTDRFALSECDRIT